jgi:hypothetical protein
MKLFEAIFPVILVLLFFSFFNTKEIKKGALLRFMVIAVLVSLGVLFVLFLSGFKFATRYFYGIAVIAICFAAPGVVFLSEKLRLILKRYSPFLAKNSIAIIMLICASICIGKALRFKMNSKRWIYDTAETIKNQSKGAEKLVLISNNPDRRAAYYADAEFIKFITEEDKVFADNKEVKSTFGMLATIGIKDQVGRFVKMPQSNGLGTLKQILEKLPKNTFILMRMPDSVFRKKFEDVSVVFPFKLIKTMKDDKKREICLYVLKD